MRGFCKVVGCAVALAGLAAAVDIGVQLNASGAARARARNRDRIIWTGNQWKVEFKDKTPCQKSTFSSTDTGANRICTVTVTCNNADRSGCGVYKYTSTADGQTVDPDVEIVP